MSSSAMHVATTGLNAQQLKMQIIANNLANVNTNGFKRDRANFESLLYQVMRSGGAQTSDGTMLTSSSTIGTGVRLVSTDKLYTQGSLTSTENSMDMAIDGQGFFTTKMPPCPLGTSLPASSTIAASIPGKGSVQEPGTMGVTPGSGVIMWPPVSVCQKVSTIGQRLPPMCL